MPRVICDRPNASELINGVRFHPLEEGGVISDEISLERAQQFLAIPGYSLDEEDREPEKPAAPPPPTTRKGKKAAAAEVLPAPPAADEPPAAPASADEPPAGEPADEVF